MSNHKNVEMRASILNEGGDEIASIYTYADKEIYVYVEDSYQLLRKEDCYYEYDSAESDQVDVLFGMGDALEQDWAAWMKSPLGETEVDGETVVETSEADGSLYLTLEIPVEYFAEDIPQTDIIAGKEDEYFNLIELDADTYEAKSIVSYLEKADGTKVTASEFSIAYDVAPYEPSEEVRLCMDGTDKTMTVIADAGTSKEKTYSWSCGENGRLGVILPSNYKKLYDDEECTQEHVAGSANEEVLLYVAEGK